MFIAASIAIMLAIDFAERPENAPRGRHNPGKIPARFRDFAPARHIPS
jgi:hypothetical protein